MKAARRLDMLLTDRGLAPSRQVAQALIMEGHVTVNGRRQDKPGARVADDAEVAVAVPARAYASRGGVKLAGALDAFAIDVAGTTAVDIGASTGGFTDCLLQRGAARVFAVDVGRGQLDWKLRNDPRVLVFEGMNARHLAPADLPSLGEGADIVVIDVSFISLRLILPRAALLLRGAQTGAPSGKVDGIVALVKPQFEVGKGRVGRGGIVRNPEDRRQALAATAVFARSIGLGVAAMARSPITGAEGNVEYFIHMVAAGGGATPQEIEEYALRLTREEQD